MLHRTARALLFVFVTVAGGLACNAILGNGSADLAADGGEVEPGSSSSGTGSSGVSASSSGAPSGSSGSPGTSSGSNTSSGSSTSGGSTCACAAGCVENATTLCKTEEAFNGLTGASLSASHLALYYVATNRVHRCAFATGDCDTTLSMGAITVLATPDARVGGDDELYVLRDTTVGYLGPPAVAEIPVAGLDSTYTPVHVGPAGDAVYAVLRASGDDIGRVSFLANGATVGGSVLLSGPAPARDSGRYTSNESGVYIAPAIGLSTIDYVGYDRAVQTVTFPAPLLASRVLDAMAASESRLYLAGPCGLGVGICALDGFAPTEIVPIMASSVRVTHLFSDGAVLYWTQADATTMSSWRCVATDCGADQRVQLGGGDLVGFAHDANYVYYALRGGAIYRVQRTF